MAVRRVLNGRLRAARLLLAFPAGTGLQMSRRELADLVNVHLATHDIGYLCIDANHIGKFECGEHIWPQRAFITICKPVRFVSAGIAPNWCFAAVMARLRRRR